MNNGLCKLCDAADLVHVAQQLCIQDQALLYRVELFEKFVQPA